MEDKQYHYADEQLESMLHKLKKRDPEIQYPSAKKVVKMCINLNCNLNMELDKIEQDMKNNQLTFGDEGQQNENKQGQQIQSESLFSQKYKGITIRLMIGRLCLVFVYNGITIFLPSILAQIMPKVFCFYMSLALIQMCTYFIGPTLVNHPEIGRKKTTYWTFTAIMLASSVSIGMVNYGVIPVLVASIVIKGANSISQMSFNIYSNELYEPLMRGKAQMVINMMGRIAMVVLGGFGFVALQFFNGRGVFVLFGIISFVAAVAIYTMPYCTSNSKA